MTRSHELFARAKELIPGGVSSPARAFGAVGGDPVVAARGEGAYLFDADGNAFVDYIQGFGAVILGHAHPAVRKATEAAARRGGALGLSTEAEVRLAEEIVCRMPAVERVRFVTSGTEASMTAARIARAATRRDVVVKFEGCYHGHADAFLAKAGSGVATYAVPAAEGVPAHTAAGTIVLPFNDGDALSSTLSARGHEIAAVFVEPVAANMGVVEPVDGFLERLLDAAHAAGTVVVFDEVVTGFRVGAGGAQGAFELRPDLTMLGKVIGGGLPVGAVAGRADLMDRLLPSGPVYQAGTFAAHPHAMSAGTAVLERLTDSDFDHLAEVARALADGLESSIRESGTAASVVRHRTFLSVHFRREVPADYAAVSTVDRAAFARFHRSMRDHGVLVPPSPFEAWFPSLAHGDEEIEKTLDAARIAFEASLDRG